MTLRHDPDPSEADWIVGTEDVDDAGTRALQGPPGLPAYATVWFDAEQDEHRRADPDLVADVTRLAAAHTRRPDRAWFALWDGWGGIDGGRTYAAMTQDRWFGRFFSAPRPQTVPPAFDARVLEAPRPSLLDLRSYLLFTGDLAAVGAWGARPQAPGWPRDLPQASFTWPADRAWCITSDVEPDWFCVGGSQGLVDAVLARPDLRSEPAAHGGPPDA